MQSLKECKDTVALGADWQTRDTPFGRRHRQRETQGRFMVSSMASGVPGDVSRPPAPWKIQRSLTHTEVRTPAVGGQTLDTSLGFRGFRRRGKTLPLSRLEAGGKKEQQVPREREDHCCHGDAWCAFTDADPVLQIASYVRPSKKIQTGKKSRVRGWSCGRTLS